MTSLVPSFSSAAQVEAMRKSLTHVAEELNLKASVRLWTGELIPLGTDVDPRLELVISEPGVVGALIRKPTAENLLNLFATGKIDLVGGNLIEFREAVRMAGSSRQKVKSLNKGLLIRNAIPFLFSRTKDAAQADEENRFQDDAVDRKDS